MVKPLLSIIFVNYNTTNLLLASIRSLKKQASSFPYEIIVVDNGSKEKKEKEVRKLISAFKGQSLKPKGLSFETIQNPKNKGFGAGNNLGAKKAVGDYLLFLNPDTLVKDNSISRLLIFLKDNPGIGALSPLLYNPNGQLQKHFYADNLSLIGITIGRWKGRQIDLNQSSVEVGMVSGAAMMVRRELFEKIGGFDERFFMYLEDDDLCLRFQQAGFQNVVLTTAKVIHLEGQSSVSRDKRKWYYQSQDYYFRKHYGPVATLIMKIIRLPYKAYKLVG